MKDFLNLNLGFNDASNYKLRENKNLLNRFFFQDEQLEHLLAPSTYFLLGDKGTGKTAYSVYLANNEHKDFACTISDIHETEYRKFISLKKKHKLELSDYTNIWKDLLLLLLAKQLNKGEDWASLVRNHWKFGKINDVVDTFYHNAFSPEIEKAITFIEDFETSGSLMGGMDLEKCGTEAKISTKESRHQESVSITFQTNLMVIENQFRKAISSVKLTKNHILFIDGIDLRPHNIAYEEYLECVKGLANAVLMINTTFLANIKDSKGRMRVILLLRPDIFAKLGLHNANNIARDNSVLLDWKTSYPQYEHSSIFKLADRILSAQQEEPLHVGEAWKYYFPFKSNDKIDKLGDDSFVLMLRNSTFRPREIISFMKILQSYVKKRYPKGGHDLTFEDFRREEVQEEYSKYLLGEIKDYLAFYHTEDDYEIFLTFFRFLNGCDEFNYSEYVKAYNNFTNFLNTRNLSLPIQFGNSGDFLQFLYDMNVICYIIEGENGEPIFHWSYRDKDYSNVTPKVDTLDSKYRIHYGLQKALNVGRKICF